MAIIPIVQSAKNKTMKRSIITLSIIATAILSLNLVGCKSKDKEKDAPANDQIQAIDVAYPVVDSVVLHREYPGTLKAANEVNLVARVNGYLVSTPYEPGSVVQKGAVLYCIEDSKYSNDVAQAQAQLNNARATYDYSSRQYQAMKKALESDAVSQMDVIQAKSAMEEAEAAIKNAEAALHSAQLDLSYCTVTAPFTGRVSKCAYSVGAYLGGAGSPVVLGTIYDDAQLNAYFAIEDAQYLKMLNAEINKENIDYKAIPLSFTQELSHKYTGELDYLAPSIDPSTGTMSIRAKVNNPYGELRSGQYVKIMLPYASDPHAILVKDASISTDQKGKYVYVVNDENKVVYTPIEVGELVNDTMRIVTSGLTPESRYVTKALLKVRDGMEVKPIETR